MLAQSDPVVAAAFEKHTTVLVGKFLAGPARFLLESGGPDQEKDMCSLLADEISQSLHYSIHLWSLRSYITIYSLQSLRLGTPFGPTSKVLEVHQSQILELEEGHNGSPIAMLIQPGVIARDTEEQFNEQNGHRVWLKGRVWLDT